MYVPREQLYFHDTLMERLTPEKETVKLLVVKKTEPDQTRL